MTEPRSVPSLDVQACVRLLEKIADTLAESARHIKSEMEEELAPSVEGYRDDLAKEFADDDGNAKLARALASALLGMGEDSERWNAVLNSARIRVLGSSGLHGGQYADGKYAHIGLELWTMHPSANASVTAENREELILYADIARAARATQPEETSR